MAPEKMMLPPDTDDKMAHNCGTRPTMRNRRQTVSSSFHGGVRTGEACRSRFLLYERLA